MFSLLINILLADTFVLFVLTLLIGQWERKGQRTRLLLLNNARRWLCVLFPWLVVMLWLERPARRRYCYQRLYEATFLLSIFGLLALLVWGTLNDIPVLPDGSVMVILWVVFLHLCLKTNGQDGGNSGRRDNGPAPTRPTPTGDAADRWVRNQQSQADHPSSLVSPAHSIPRTFRFHHA